MSSENFLSLIEKYNLSTLLKSLKLPSSWSFEMNEDGISLITNEGKPFRLDFSKLQTLSKGQPLAKAIGCKEGDNSKVLDVTAGWGQDAFLLASLGCQVKAIESHPLVFAFLIDAFHKKNLKKPDSLEFILDNSVNYLKNLKEEARPNVIYIDPMFEAKKSLSRKPLKILETLVGPTKNADELFQLALTKALNRVVVKRHRLEAPKTNATRLCSFEGRSVCYDVFAPKE